MPTPKQVLTTTKKVPTLSRDMIKNGHRRSQTSMNGNEPSTEANTQADPMQLLTFYKVNNDSASREKGSAMIAIQKMSSVQSPGKDLQ